MLYWWLQVYGPGSRGWESVAAGPTPVYLTARTACATVTAFLLALLFGPWAIAWLKSRFTERIDSASARLNELHASKNATPTMGGIFIVGSILGAGLLFGDLSSPLVQQALVVVSAFGCLGAIDDWIKIRTSRRGLTVAQKFIGQVIVSVGITGWLATTQPLNAWTQAIAIPLSDWIIPIGVFFPLWGSLVIVGASNGVNLTDGLDGLAGGCLIFAGTAFVALTYLAGHRVMADYLGIPHVSGAGELSVLFGAMVGAVLGFLWFNCYPAQVFMGDTGSLPTGALLGYGALAIHQELLLAVVGGVFVIETLSVIGQIGWFKLTGKRLIACSPLHNHFLFQGQHEIKIVVRFWIGSALLALLAVASLKIR
ncbi:phospho-N-acetylmuramoyl-pentapeptide-transferase [bacterium]|nr:phospho-N-acetylmuramoyl-pentapeptide-transferase [bacterium]